MSECTVVGLQPWLPAPLSRWAWWTEPIRAERLAALRIGVAAALLVDVLSLYLPRSTDFFGPDSLGGREVFGHGRSRLLLSTLGRIDDPHVLYGAGVVWAVAAGLLLVGWRSRWSAATAWSMAQLFFAQNPLVHNAGDTVRTIILFYLMLSPCGATWSLDHWRQRKRDMRSALTLFEREADICRSPGVYVHPWPLCLLFVQMTVIYFSNGVHKLLGPQWRAGHSLHYVLGDLTLTRWSYAQLPMPYELS